MQSIRGVNVRGKRVLVRADFNVSLGTDGRVVDDFRIRATLPTIKYLMENGAKIVLAAHLGRPKGKVVDELKLEPIQKKLSEHLNAPVQKAADCVGQEAQEQANKLQPGEILLLENLRFYPGEKENDKDFATKLAELGDIYVNDAFGVCHRIHASVAAITEILPSYAGLLLEKEIEVLSDILEKPQLPLCVVIGGAKISTKIGLIQEFLIKADNILLGGALANTVLHAQGIAVGKSMIEKAAVPEVRELKITDTKLHLPVDALASTKKDGSASVTTAPIGRTGTDELILDIGPDTAELFGRIIGKSKTVIWNGPMGVFEVPVFAQGTEAIAQQIFQSQAFSVVGGGETTCFLEQKGIIDKFSHVSTGGGAMLKFLAGEELPGLQALNLHNM